MGGRGPSPKPEWMKVLAGNPGKRPLKKTASKVKRQQREVASPQWLDQEAKAHWKSAAPALREAGLLTNLDLRCLLPDVQRLGPDREAAQGRRSGICHSVRSGPAAAGGGYKSPIPGRDPRILEGLRNDAGQPGAPVAAPVARGKERLRQVARWRLSGLRVLPSSR